MIKQFLVDGGPWMLPILALSVVALMFVLERAWFWIVLWFRRDPALRRRILLGDAPHPGARTGDPLAVVLLELARSPEEPDEAMDRARALVRRSKQHLRTLVVASSLGSSLGLFGTVVGLSASLGGVRLGSPDAITAGLQTALNTTIFGLLVYVGTYVAHAVFSQLSANLGHDLEEDLNEARRALLARRGALVA
jgi:biopolymer transport protein ExbB/TolQ